jgi:hypothetical protein
MPRSDGRVRPGQKLDTAFSARAWNRAQDAADLVLRDRGGLALGEASPTPRGSNIIVIKNMEVLKEVGRFGVLEITDVEVDPSESASKAASFAERAVFVGRAPLSVTSRIVICLEPIEYLKFGRALVGGTFACKVRVNDPSHNFAVPIFNETAQLQTASCGPVALLWKDISGWSQSNRDNRWAAGVM